MPELKLEIKSRDVEYALSLIINRVRNPAGLMHNIATDLASRTDKAFRAKASPDGKAWAPLSMVTLHMRGLRAAKGRQTGRNGKVLAAYKRGSSDTEQLFVTGGLLRSVRAESSSTQAIVTAGPHPSGVAIHQFGGKAGRGRKVTIPARPFMPLTLRGNELELMPVAEKSVLFTIRRYVEKGL